MKRTSHPFTQLKNLSQDRSLFFYPPVKTINLKPQTLRQVLSQLEDMQFVFNLAASAHGAARPAPPVDPRK